MCLEALQINERRKICLIAYKSSFAYFLGIQLIKPDEISTKIKRDSIQDPESDTKSL